MGTTFGKVSVETPKYTVVEKKVGYEIRDYPPQVMVQFTASEDTKDQNHDGFNVLASYIGVISSPQNEKTEKVAMTAPVVSESQTTVDNQVAYTENATENKPATMAFILPDSYTMKSAPQPTDPRLKLHELPQRRMAVMQFSGRVDMNSCQDQVKQLRKQLDDDGVRYHGNWQLARYNPPWCVPSLRTNEILFLLD